MLFPPPGGTLVLMNTREHTAQPPAWLSWRLPPRCCCVHGAAHNRAAAKYGAGLWAGSLALSRVRSLSEFSHRRTLAERAMLRRQHCQHRHTQRIGASRPDPVSSQGLGGLFLAGEEKRPTSWWRTVPSRGPRAAGPPGSSTSSSVPRSPGRRPPSHRRCYLPGAP